MVHFDPDWCSPNLRLFNATVSMHLDASAPIAKNILHSAVITHLEASQRFFILIHPMAGELAQHVSDHALAGKRLVAGNAVKRLFFVQR